MKFLQRFLQCLFRWGQPAEYGDVHKAQAILTQSMCDLTDGRVSEINKKMAELVKRLNDKLKIPVVAQGDLVPALKEVGVPIFSQTRALPKQSIVAAEYFGSEIVVVDQKKICDKMGWSKVIIIATIPHVWRARWIYEKQGFEVIIPAEIPKMIFQKNLVQPRWRKAVTAYPYEFLARLYFLCKGYI